MSTDRASKFLLTMQYEEDFLLPIFLRHYSKYFSPQNIFVIDHGSDRNLIPPGFNRIFIPRDRPFSEEARLLLVRNVTQGLLNYYDFGVYADCDELIALDQFDAAVLQTQPEIYVAGFDVFQREGPEAKKLLGFLSPVECKPLIFSRTPLWSLGFHSSASCAPGVLTIPMAHIRYLDKERARSRLLKRKSVYENHMNKAEKSTGNIAFFWSIGEQRLEEFYAHVGQFDQVVPETFVSVSAQLVFDPVTRSLSDGREIVVQVPKGEWQVFGDRCWDLSSRFEGLAI